MKQLSEVRNLLNRLQVIKTVFDYEIQAIYILSILPNTWEILVASLQNYNPNAKLTKTMVQVQF